MIENREEDQNSLDGKDWIQQQHGVHESDHRERRASVNGKVRKVCHRGGGHLSLHSNADCDRASGVEI